MTNQQNHPTKENERWKQEFLTNTIGQKIQLTTSVEEVLQTAIREIGLAFGAARVSANIGTSRQLDGDGASRN